MILAGDIIDRVKALNGNCREPEAYALLTEAVRVLGNKGDFDPLMGVVDIVAQGNIVALPPEVETVISVNLGNYPTVGRDRYFNFHLNGPGDFPVVEWGWQDSGEFPLFIDPVAGVPEEFYAYHRNAADAGATLRLYGIDQNGDVLRNQDSPGVWTDGIPIVSSYGAVITFPPTVKVARVTAIRKPATVGPVVLLSYLRNPPPPSPTPPPFPNPPTPTVPTVTLRGVYQYDQLNPLFRRIILKKNVYNATSGAVSNSCRIVFRRKSLRLTKADDWIPLYSESAVLTMVQSIRALREERYSDAAMSESVAMRYLTEEHETHQPPVLSPIQINNSGSPFSGGDRLE